MSRTRTAASAGAIALAALTTVLEPAAASAWQADCPQPEFMQRADIPGLGLAEVSGEQIDVSAFGYAERPSACVTESTIFEAASLTKPVVAYAVLRLVDRGRLGLDDPLVDLLPTLPLPPDDPRSARVTVRMALSHSTGLRGPDDRTLAFEDDPGEAFRYYPPGYRLVQRAIEHLENATLEEIARREVFEPLGMQSSSLVYRVEFADRLATRHRMLGEPIERQREPGRPANAAASLLTTPGDYGRFLRAMLDGEGLTTDSHAAMLEPQIRVPGTNGAVAWGVGWGLEPDRGTFFHWGDDGAAKCFTMGSTDRDEAFAYFTNSFYGMAVAGEFAADLLPGDSPAVQWLGYPSWDAPERLARRDTVRAFVEGDADRGMATFERYQREHPELDMDAVASFVSWILDGRSLHDGRVRLLARQIERQPGNAGLQLDRARSLRALGRSAEAIDALRAAMPLVDASTAASITGQIGWIEDELAAADPARAGARPPLEQFVGSYGPRRVSIESGAAVYQRGDGPRFTLRWMRGTTFALEGNDTFRIRFVPGQQRATSIIGLYADGRTDESPRSD
ncbi:MAG: serine hydrolase domain-containing protein [Planctomycetota bacterium]